MAQRDIKYLNKDFNSFKEALINYAKAYFPTTYNDFNDADPGNMFIEMAAYVGEVLGFYLDRQNQEVYLEYARQKDNLITMAYMLGYRPRVTSTAIVDLDVYQLLPSIIQSGSATPDYNYCLTIAKEAKVNAKITTNVTFITEDLVDFSFSSSANPTEISVYQLNSVTNQPDYYLLKKSVKAIAGDVKSQQFSFGQSEKFATITLEDTNIIQILDVTDSDGNKWYEVPYLAQNTIFEQIQNTQLNDPNYYKDSNNVPYILRTRKVQRRFTARFNSNEQFVLEFGAGVSSSPDEIIIPNSDNVGMGLIDSISKLNTAYDPTNFLYTREYGLAPANTTLTVRYIVGGGVETNVPANTINTIHEINIGTVSSNPLSLNQPLLQNIKQTVAFNNENRAAGGGDGDSVEDIRQKTLANFPTQLRTVTTDDYEIRSLSMPSNFGTIAKAYCKQDDTFEPKNSSFIDNNPLALSLYILSYDINKNMVTGSLALKENLKTYISEYNMATDAVTIKDAYYINIGCNFDIIVLPKFNSREVLSKCLDAVKSYFDIDKWKINQPIFISDIFNILIGIEGVQNVIKVDIVNKQGEDKGYSKYGYDIVGATKNNIVYPSIDPAIFEVRYPDNDIYGRIVTI